MSEKTDSMSTPQQPPDREHRTRPERTVVRAGVSPMNPKVKWAELSCGHDVYRTRKPRLGATIVCEKCSVKI